MRSMPLMLLAALVWFQPVAWSRDRELPLHDGKLRIHDLNRELCEALHLPTCPAGGEIDLSGTQGAEFLSAVNASLWDGTSLRFAEGVASLHLDDQNPPGTCEALRRMTRVYTAERYPRATAAQAREWGLLLPRAVDPGRPIVVLIHGLDADRSDCMPMGDLLTRAGYQVAYFSYPGDRSIAESGKRLARGMKKLRAQFPTTAVDFVAHSMGGLVARSYVEGPDYLGGVKHLILVAPPNHGSSWAHLRTLLSLEENYHLRRDDPNWKWTWLITEGLGEAGTDLLPSSEFLKALDAQPRRAGVQYTIIAGSKSSVSRVESTCLLRLSDSVPGRARNWWGVHFCYARLHAAAGEVREQTGASDGPVSICSARLKGVDDFVILPADHVSLYLPVDGHPPAAWGVVKDRLSR